MADSSTLSFRLDDEIIDRLDLAAGEAGTSRSGLAREALLVGLEELTDESTGEVDVPDHLGHDAEIKRLIARNKAERREGKFRSEFSKQLKTSFKNNETPSEFEKSVSGYIEEADRLGELPADVKAEIDADVSTYAEWVDYMLDYYRAGYAAQNYDHDPVNNPLAGFEGIESAKEWMDAAEAIANAEDQVREQDRDTTYGESEAVKERRREIARKAIESGNIPDQITQRIDSETPQDRIDAIIEAAEEAAGSGQQAVDDQAPTPQIED